MLNAEAQFVYRLALRSLSIVARIDVLARRPEREKTLLFDALHAVVLYASVEIRGATIANSAVVASLQGVARPMYPQGDLP